MSQSSGNKLRSIVLPVAAPHRLSDPGDVPVTERRSSKVVRTQTSVIHLLRPSSSKIERLSVVNKLRKQMKKKTKDKSRGGEYGQDEVGCEATHSKIDSFRQQLDPKTKAWIVDFQRYDTEATGELPPQSIRAALCDIGLQPFLPIEKQAVSNILAEEVGQSVSGELNFDSFVRLAGRLREDRNEAMRAELEEFFRRGLDNNGVCQMEQVRKCLESLGCSNMNGEPEWNEVQAIFDGYNDAAIQCHAIELENGESIVSEAKTELHRQLGIKGAKSRPTEGGNQGDSPRSALMRAKQAMKNPSKEIPNHPEGRRGSTKDMQNKLSIINENEGKVCTPFELWERLFYTAKERLFVVRRGQERAIAQEMELTDKQFEDFRSDLIELYAIFKQFDADGSGALEEDEVRTCLACSGALRKHGQVSQEEILELMFQAKEATRKAQHDQDMRG